MAKIGDVLNSPEEKWERHDLESLSHSYTGQWSTANSRPHNFTGGSMIFTTIVNSSLVFEFFGSGIRLIVESDMNYDAIGEVDIDGVKSNFSCYENTSYKGKVLAFEKTGLKNELHRVTIKKISNDTKALNVDSVDILYSHTVLTLKNPTTNQYYSLAEKTLIPLLNTSDKNMILHGVKASKEIKLDEAFDKINYIVENPTIDTTNNLKVFTQTIEVKPNKLWIKEVK